MCESGHYTVATTLKTAVDAEQVVESQEDTVQGLFQPRHVSRPCLQGLRSKGHLLRPM
jgi:hypothetical protein